MFMQFVWRCNGVMIVIAWEYVQPLIVFLTVTLKHYCVECSIRSRTLLFRLLYILIASGRGQCRPQKRKPASMHSYARWKRRKRDSVRFWYMGSVGRGYRRDRDGDMIDQVGGSSWQLVLARRILWRNEALERGISVETRSVGTDVIER